MQDLIYYMHGRQLVREHFVKLTKIILKVEKKMFSRVSVMA